MNPYYSLSDYLKDKYHKKLYKIAIDAGFTCPNRDGTLDTRGCIFCSAGGSGDFAIQRAAYPTISSQIEQGVTLFGDKFVSKSSTKETGSRETGAEFIAYFQAYTCTYGSAAFLEKIYTEALEHEKIAGISIATRPDCLSDEVCSLLAKLKAKYPNKFIWIELGLQTIHEKTAIYIRRGYPLSVFEEAVNKMKIISIPVIVHVILGLPGETKDDMLSTIHYLNKWNIFGIKLQLLHILRGTDLAADYLSGAFEVLSQDAYIDIVIDCLEALSPKTIIHRVTGDGPKDLLIAPLWSANKRNVLNTLHHRIAKRSAYQGRTYHDPGSFNTL